MSARSVVSRFVYDGATLVVEEFPAERAGGGTTYVLVHGIGMGRSVFAELITLLRKSNRVIAVDLPGYGEAPEPPRTLSMPDTADLLAAMLRAHDLAKVTLVGHSMGSQIVTEVAARHPGCAARVVLVAPTVNAHERRAVRQILRLGQDLAGESLVVLARGAREYLRAGPHLRQKLRATIVHRPENAYPLLRLPVLVLRGSHDRVCPPAWCAQVARLLPDGRLREVEGHGHETVIRDPDAAAAMIRAFVDGA